MNRITVAVICILLAPLSMSSQELKGLYLLSVNDNVYYVDFNKQSFELFSLQPDPRSANNSLFTINEIGKGRYVINDKALELNFDDRISTTNALLKDSINYSMNSEELTNQNVFKVNLNVQTPVEDNIYLVVEGKGKEYRQRINKNTLEAQIIVPDSIIVRNVYLSIMGLGKRSLMYHYHSNRHWYNYFLRDSEPEIIDIFSKTWKWGISKKDSKTDSYKFNEAAVMKRATTKDVQFLQNISTKVEKVGNITKTWDLQ